MRKIRIQDRFDRSIDAFFEHELLVADSRLVPNENSGSLLGVEIRENILNKFGTASNLAKLLFFFIPGSFFLFRFSVTFGYVVFFQQNTITPGYDVDYHYIPYLLQELAMLTFFLFSGCFLTYIGVGRLKDVKNLLVPASIISLSFGLAALCSVFPEPIRGRVIMYYSIYLFPVLLIASGFIKHWITDDPNDRA